jgi:hypothetical protein
MNNPAALPALPLIASVTVLIGACAPYLPPVNSDTIPALLRNTTAPSVSSLRAVGEMELAFNGERLLLKTFAAWNGDQDFSCDLHTSWGGVAAMVQTGQAGGEIEAGGKSYTVGFDQPLTDFEYLPPMPFRFRDLIRIITGSYIAEHPVPGLPDTILTRGKKAILVWRGDSTIVEAVIGRRAGRVESLCYRPAPRVQEHWALSFSRFKDGFPRTISYVLDKNNFFTLSWERYKQAPKQD